jgi:hypothetical protein
MGSIELPDELRAALDQVGVFAGLIEANGEAALLVKLPLEEQANFREAAVRFWYELGQTAAGPVLALVVEIMDDPEHPILLESFLNVNSAPDLALARKLITQLHLTIHFLDEHLAHNFSKRMRHRSPQRAELSTLVSQAVRYLQEIQVPDWQSARAEFMRRRQRKGRSLDHYTQ